jgi:hypothetical protein
MKDKINRENGGDMEYINRILELGEGEKELARAGSVS